jgi:NADH-quinone oxidoreductase subunit B
MLQKKIDKEKISQVRWYRKGHDSVEIPVPILGPDLIDPRRIPDIKAKAAEMATPAQAGG